MNEKYPALKFEVKLYRILGWICLVITIFVTIILLGDAWTVKEIAIALVKFLAGLLGTLFIFTLGESIQLFIDIENNTREK